jgi:hypothetical protein
MSEGYRATVWVIAMLVLATLACNLTQDDGSNDSTQLVNNTTPPSIRILNAPTSATVNQPINVEVEATANSGSVTRVEMLVNGLPVTQQSGTGQSTLRTTLSWTPLRQGEIRIAVVAYAGVTASPPQTLNLRVTATPSQNPGDSGGGNGGVDTNLTPSAPNQGPCRAQMTTSLRLRSEPSTAGGAATIIRVFNIGTEAPIIARLPDNSWFQVQDPVTGQQGWVFYNNNDGQYFTLIGRCVGIPVAQEPATPTPQPTAFPTATTAPPVNAQPPDIVVLPISGSTNLQLDVNGTATGSYGLQVQNSGGSDTGAFQVLVVLPGGQEVVRNINNLSPGQTISVAEGGGGQQQITFTDAGQQRISIFADFDGSVTESSEANNVESLDIVISE